MLSRLLLPALFVLTGLAVSGCLLPPEGPFAKEKAPSPPSVEDTSRFTLTEAVFLNGQKVGYTLTFLEVPRGSKEKQQIDAGTVFIKDLDFKNLGFISPLGNTFRYNEQSEGIEVCQFTLEKNLAYFFGAPEGKVELKDIAVE